MSAVARAIFYISDNTAVSVRNIGQSLITQFHNVDFQQVFRPFIDTPQKAKEVAEEISSRAKVDGKKPIVFSSIVDKDAREIIFESGGVVFDLYDTFLKKMEEELQVFSTPAIGRPHRIFDEAHGIWVDTVNYTLNHDDGLTIKDYNRADVIIIGLSRTGKTPTCVYLAMQFSIYAANYPMTEDDFFSTDKNLSLMLSPYRTKLFGLTIDPERLSSIRAARMPDSRYSSLKQCLMETRIAEDFFEAEGIPYVNITRMSVEEIATHIMHVKALQRRVW